MRNVIDGQQGMEAFDQKTGADEEHQRKRNLRDDQGAAKAVADAAGGGATAALFKRFTDVGARDEQGGSDAGENSAEDGDGESEGESASVQADGVPAGDIFCHV